MFGRVVREHRRRMGLSQEELAQRAGISVRGLSKLEAGRTAAPRPATVRLLADAFGLRDAERDRFCHAANSNAAPDTADQVATPAQLPPDVWAFTGRTAELAQLDAPLAIPDHRSTAVLITSVSGTAGVGKTALAVHWAHRVVDQFPHGQLYVNLRGFDPGGTIMDPAEAIRRFLDALGVPPQRIPADLDAQVSLYRSLLADKKMLIVLDNARDPDQIDPLLPGAPGCLVLITSRNRLSGLVATTGAHPIGLDLLTVDDARALLASRIGIRRVAAEPHATDQIIAYCARLPAALAIVAANHHPTPAVTGGRRHPSA